jgi:hypothetical protein
VIAQQRDGDVAVIEIELATYFEACWASEDAVEGQCARAAKRPPRFLGR